MSSQYRTTTYLPNGVTLVGDGAPEDLRSLLDDPDVESVSVTDRAVGTVTTYNRVPPSTRTLVVEVALNATFFDGVSAITAARGVVTFSERVITAHWKDEL